MDPTQSLPAAGQPVTSIPAPDLQGAELPAAGLPAASIPATDPGAALSATGIPAADPGAALSAAAIPAAGVPGTGHGLVLPSPWEMFLDADPVVKGVMLLLLLASLACWTVMLEKYATLRRLRREARAFATTTGELPETLNGREDLASAALRGGLPEWRRGQGARETDGEYRLRLEAAMRKPVAGLLRRAEGGMLLLATTGSVAPFIGLLGTVWGIMNSFVGIAASNDTSLAVVAPGIAEALFATAIGLFAAIPAVVGYNRLTAAMAALRHEALGAASDLALRLSRAAPPLPQAAE